jgi:hypothetical protein
MAMVFAGPAYSESETEQIEDSEQPGSEFEMDVDEDGQVEFGRKGQLEAQGAAPGKGDRLEVGDEDVPLLDPLDDPDTPDDPDPIDEELPGEGPEDLSGPDDADPLPY